jgi:hypothetical protein
VCAGNTIILSQRKRPELEDDEDEDFDNDPSYPQDHDPEFQDEDFDDQDDDYDGKQPYSHCPTLFILLVLTIFIICAAEVEDKRQYDELMQHLSLQKEK